MILLTEKSSFFKLLTAVVVLLSSLTAVYTQQFNINTCTEEQLGIFGSQLEPTCLTSLSGVHPDFNANVLYPSERSELLREMCTTECSGRISQYYDTCCNNAAEGANLVRWCTPTGSSTPGQDRCYFAVPPILNVLNFDGLIACDGANATNPCPTGCRGSLTSVSTKLGCCYQSFYNSSEFITSLPSITVQLYQSLTMLQNPLLWAACGVPISDACTGDPFPVSSTIGTPSMYPEAICPLTSRELLIIGCDPLTSPDYGTVQYYYLRLHQENAVLARYSCFSNNGYILNATNNTHYERICRQGDWNGFEPSCVAVDCGPLPHPSHGTVRYTQTIYESEASYECDDTYVPLGYRTRICLSNGEWSGMEPLCEVVTVGFQTKSYIVSEDVDTLSVCVTLNYNSSLFFPIVRIVLRLYTSENTADESDFGRLNSIMTLHDMKLVDCVNVSITNDKRYEQDEQFVVNLEILEVVRNIYEAFPSLNSTTVTIQTNDVMFPFGVSEGDTRLSDVIFSFSDLDDVASPAIHLSHPFNFFNQSETILYVRVNSNGLLSFRESYTTPVIKPFESHDLPSIPLIAPLWTDIDIDSDGKIFYRQTDELVSLQHAMDLVEAARLSPDVKSSFNVTNLFIATWDSVTGFSVGNDLMNTFQVVLAMDGSNSFIFFIYDQLEWIRDPTNIGFRNSNNSQSFMLISNTTIEEEICELRLTETSNVGILGLYLYQVDDLEVVDCGSLLHPSHGTVQYIQTTSGELVATYKCDVTYVLLGDGTRICQNDGEWSGIEPLCERCEVLLFPDNGYIQYSKQSEDDMVIASYVCFDGYILNTTEPQSRYQRTCLPDGNWSGFEPSCTEICDAINVNNGSVLFHRSPRGIRAKSICDEGYRISGDKLRMCDLETGIWKGNDSTCELVDCGPLSHPDHGMVQYNLTMYESEATYRCDVSFVLLGDGSTRTCQGNGDWSGLEPLCGRCEVLPFPNNGYIQYSKQSEDDMVIASYGCFDGYILNTTEPQSRYQRTCLPDGNWSGFEPSCIGLFMVDCGPLPHPSHGTVRYTQTTYESEATYECDDTYVPLGDRTRICLSNGEWSGMEPLCDMVTVGFQNESYSISEDDNSVTICAVLNYNSTFRIPIVGINLRLYTSQGTADESDYTRRDRDDTGVIINVAKNSAVSCVMIFITNDQSYEQDEQFVVNLELIDVIPDSYDVLLSSNVTTVTILTNDLLFSFGNTQSDTRLSDNANVNDYNPSDSSSPVVNLKQPFTFFKENETTLYVNSNGLLSFREPYTTSEMITIFESRDLPSIPLIAPLWTNIDIDSDGEIFFRQTDELVSLQHAMDLVEAARLSPDVKSSFNPTNLFIATWDHVAATYRSSDTDAEQDLRNTFQVTLAMDGNNSFIFFIYDQLEWIRDPTNIGFRNSNNSRSFMLISNTTIEDEIRELRLTDTSNVGVPGLYLYQVDESSKLAPKILETETDKPNHMLQYNVGLNNSFCLEDDQEEVNFTIHCNSEQTLVPQSIEWTYNHGMILDLNQSEISNVLRYRNDQSLLSFGPVSLMDIARALNISIVNSSESIIFSCQLSNDFGQDIASIEISMCAPNVCQDGVTNNCNQLCSRDSNGVYQCACEEGYELEPDNSTCEIIDCRSPSPLGNGTVNVTMTTFNSPAFYSCNDGFRLSGDDTRVCQDTGLWSGSDPICEDIDECVEGSLVCGTNEECRNNEGSAECICVAGFERNGATCEGAQTETLTAVYVIVVLIIAAVIITVLVVIYLIYRKRRSLADQKLMSGFYNASGADNSNMYLQGEGNELQEFKVKDDKSIVGDIHRELLIYTVNLKILETVGQGEFGVVYKGHLLKDLGQTVIGVVAIKTLKGFFDQSLVDELLKECLKMQQLSHPNVLSLTGVCLDGGQTPFLVMPFMANGSLVSYLRKERQNLVIPADSISQENKSIALKRLTDMCFQVAKGMEYLASKRFIHRDLAARNCMIDMSYVIKVADFGLSEQLETKDYFRQDKGESIKLPVKWLALESLTDYVFSEKTDVWSYGVTCWEIFSGGMVPYVSVKPTEMLSKLESGYRMEKPSNAACSDEIYDLVMLQCWKEIPAERPTFSELVKSLAQTLEAMADYLHIEAFAEQQQEAQMCASDELQQSYSVAKNDVNSL